MKIMSDNSELTFSKMKEIMTAASNGELTTEEKVDGQNLFLSYSIPEGKAKGARNKGNLKDCLLYTSPSPRDLSTSRMPSSA